MNYMRKLMEKVQLLEAKEDIFSKYTGAEWQKLKQVSEKNPKVLVNPYNPKAKKMLSGYGVSGDPNKVLNWLRKFMGRKYSNTVKNLEEMEEHSPHEISWQYGHVELTPIWRPRIPDRSPENASPNAHVLFIGETEDGDDIRYYFKQTPTPEGSFRMSILNGKEFKSGGFLGFSLDLKEF